MIKRAIHSVSGQVGIVEFAGVIFMHSCFLTPDLVARWSVKYALEFKSR